MIQLQYCSMLLIDGAILNMLNSRRGKIDIKLYDYGNIFLEMMLPLIGLAPKSCEIFNLRHFLKYLYHNNNNS
jgi:hypothetical protein